jgi:SRSO17 transposase
VFLAYASAGGHALIDRELYLPESWTSDRERCRAASIGDEVEFATKPVLAQHMIQRALDAHVPFSWLTADEAYGQVKYLRVLLEERGISYVLATRRNDDVFTPDGRTGRADEMIAAVPPKQWRRISADDGAHGPREYSWVRIPIFDHLCTRAWALAARPPTFSDPTEIAYYICAGPRRTTLTELATIAGSRWRVEECFQQAKNEAGLDQYQVRTYRAWYAHTTLSMLALAWLAGTKTEAVKGESGSTIRA